jgi:hypothetical protein
MLWQSDHAREQAEDGRHFTVGRESTLYPRLYEGYTAIFTAQTWLLALRSEYNPKPPVLKSVRPKNGDSL